ncbi:hypothetical protein, partial [Pseudomonas syringae]|uniref:hypothetical protein n=1 Tax=Pseudomonas syringae TaxID=317 RepID=UPI0034D75090
TLLHSEECCTHRAQAVLYLSVNVHFCGEVAAKGVEMVNMFAYICVWFGTCVSGFFWLFKVSSAVFL